MTSQPAMLDDHAIVDALGGVWRPGSPEARMELHLAQAEVAASQAARATATQMAAIVAVLAETRRHPELHIALHDEPTAEQLRVAVASAVADLAVRLSIAESTVAVMARQGEALIARAPRLWAAFREGEVSAANARAAADLLDTVPRDVEGDADFDTAARAIAGLAPARFRERMRVLRDRIHVIPASERHARAARARRAWREDDVDGMAWLGVHLTAVDAELAWQRLDGIARHLQGCDGETRTLDQLRADAAADILTGRTDPATEPRITVGVLVPMLTLLGENGAGQQPASLDGRIPIDPDTARRLAGDATTFHRILTDPVRSTILDVDRRSYRPPADLKRLLALRDGTCRFSGCGRRAADCDIDHTTGWAHGGPTSAGNLAHLSRGHHTVKDRALWKVEHGPPGMLTWTSPTGHVSTSDPPPF